MTRSGLLAAITGLTLIGSVALLSGIAAASPVAVGYGCGMLGAVLGITLLAFIDWKT